MSQMALSRRTQLLLGVGGVVAAAIVLSLTLLGDGSDRGDVDAAPAAEHAETLREAPNAPAADTPTAEAPPQLPPASLHAPSPALPVSVETDETSPPETVARPVAPRPVRPAPAQATVPTPREPDPAPPTPRSATNPQPVAETTAPSQTVADTRQTGIYLLRDDGRRELLVPTVVAGIGEEGGGLFSRPQRFAIVNGMKATRRSLEHYQPFEFVFPAGGTAITGQVTHPSQYVLIQLYEEEEYDERVFDVLPGGLDTEVIVPLRTEQLDGRTYRVTPTEPLGLGEFCFFILEAAADVAVGLTLFDFGIDP